MNLTTRTDRQGLQVNSELVLSLLTLPEYKNVNTQTLCYRAMRHLAACKLSVFPITDRASAIAVLMGVSKPGQPNERVA